jgi:hypothetical protein
MGEWRWANVVVRERASDRPNLLDAGKPRYSGGLRAPSPQAEVRNNLSTCPLDDEPGQVDRFVPGLLDQEQAIGEPIETSQAAEDGVRNAQRWMEALANINLAGLPADVPLGDGCS